MRTLLSLALLLLVACRAETPAPGAPPIEETPAPAPATAAAPPAQFAGACDLLRPEDIARVTDASIAAEAGAEGEISQCTWRRADGAEGTITVTMATGGEVAEAPLTEASPVPGVAGEATWNRDAGLLTIRKNDRVALVRFDGFALREESANALARVIADRM